MFDRDRHPNWPIFSDNWQEHRWLFVLKTLKDQSLKIRMLFTFYAASSRCSIKHSHWPISNWQALPTPCYIMCEGKGWGQAVSRRLVHLSDQAKLWNSYSGVWDFYNLTFPNLQKNQTKLTLSEKWRDLACFLVGSLITFCRSSSRDRSIMTYRLELNPSDHRQVLSNFLQVKEAKYN